jgi:hypothetical protein
MNIFYLDEDFDTCARYHVDKHVVKMVTEYAQLLSSAVRLSGIDAGYKLTHANHPSAIWTRESLDNWLWLRDLSEALNLEYMYRYNHDTNHKAYDVIQRLPLPNIPSIGITPFRLAMPDDVKIEGDPIQSYRNYYNVHKQHICQWTNRDMPDWYVPNFAALADVVIATD